ncbi:hypothetical protein M2256_002752 [Lactococcus lactis]|uniref:Uncharacterized protein n=1 Tax=Lactococcus lactis TaxID=1358 RepID=A0AAW5TVA7_9LACT|nr:hypothetical protein [Lactococcus lactis]
MKKVTLIKTMTLATLFTSLCAYKMQGHAQTPNGSVAKF